MFSWVGKSLDADGKASLMAMQGMVLCKGWLCAKPHFCLCEMVLRGLWSSRKIPCLRGRKKGR